MPAIQICPKLRLNYIESNPSGQPTVLLLHGLGSAGDSWGFQIPVLTEAGYRSLAPDARGFGKSSYPGGGHSVREMAGDMADLLHCLQVEKAHIVGISMGGTLALQLALDYPALVDKLVLVNTFARLRPTSPGLWLYYTFRLALVHLVGLPAQAKTVSARIFPKPGQEQARRMLYEQICQANPQGYRATMRALGRFDVFNQLGKINAPTLVVTAEHDTTVPFQNQNELFHNIPNARQVIIPDSGHGVIADQPVAFNNALLSFLSGDKA